VLRVPKTGEIFKLYIAAHEFIIGGGGGLMQETMARIPCRILEQETSGCGIKV
jgi:hypothetical protein